MKRKYKIHLEEASGLRNQPLIMPLLYVGEADYSFHFDTWNLLECTTRSHKCCSPFVWQVVSLHHLLFSNYAFKNEKEWWLFSDGKKHGSKSTIQESCNFLKESFCIIIQNISPRIYGVLQTIIIACILFTEESSTCWRNAMLEEWLHGMVGCGWMFSLSLEKPIMLENVEGCRKRRSIMR